MTVTVHPAERDGLRAAPAGGAPQPEVPARLGVRLARHHLNAPVAPSAPRDFVAAQNTPQVQRGPRPEGLKAHFRWDAPSRWGAAPHPLGSATLTDRAARHTSEAQR